ncbi:hypothetical protein SCP_1002950 [Sparassis crispa]|uniref:Pheromone n=1 Tax=Sparassis crispa TaxID=139825 RepID=A0A401GXV0_9APHY|nr:hypothetical protein SCP_1002950 [Sparassis crispa]GBE87048.1 hypothetical protein SCP_1002950 [Sparassis crispa]
MQSSALHLTVTPTINATDTFDRLDAIILVEAATSLHEEPNLPRDSDTQNPGDFAGYCVIS